jgi:hypothetical protein
MGRTKTGRLWTYVRDDRSSGDTAAPAVWFAYSPDRKGEHPKRHLQDFSGTLQADAYAGFHHLYDTGRISEAACWAHALQEVRHGCGDPLCALALACPHALPRRWHARDRQQRRRTLNRLDPEIYLEHVLERIADHPISRIEELLPWNVSLDRTTDQS